MTLPLEKLDDKTFDDLVRDAISRIPIYSPQWTDHNRTDPGITQIELLAWIVEMQIYRLDRINQKSLRKFLRLVGITNLEAAAPARVDVTFSPRRRGIGPTMIPMGTVVAAWDSMAGKEVPFETERDITALETDLRKIITISDGNLRDNFADNENENVYYYAFRSDKKEGDAFPQKGDALYLGFQFDERSAGQELTLAFYLYQNVTLSSSDLDEIGQYIPAELRWECYLDGEWTEDRNWRTLDVADETRSLLSGGKVRIWIPADARKRFLFGEGHEELLWIRCRVDKAGYEAPPMIDNILVNTVSAVHGRTFYRCKYSSSGLPGVRLALKDTPVKNARIVLDNESTEWTEVQDFDASTPDASHYVLERDSGTITFGDGINGRIPPKGDDNITIKYSSGGGLMGNVPPHSISRVTGPLAESVSVDNQRAALGGSEPGTLEGAMASARKEIKEISRAVTSEDYEYLALNTPGIKIARAKALSRYHPNMKAEVPNAVTVIVIPYGSDPWHSKNPGVLSTVYRHIDRYRLLTTELFVRHPEYVRVSVEATVAVMKGYSTKVVKDRAKMALKKFLHPLTGGPDGKGWPFGRAVYLSEIYRLLDEVDGVDYVPKEPGVPGVILYKCGVKPDGNNGDILLLAHQLVEADTITIH